MPRKTNDAASRIAVLIPYDDLESLLEAARKIDDMEKMYKHMEQKYVAIMQLYRDILERVKEIDRYL